MADYLDTSRWWFNCVYVCESLCVRRLGAWWMADYETLHVCRVPWCQQSVKFWWWPSDPIKFNKPFHSIIYAVLRTWCSIAVTRSQFLRRLLCDHAQTAAVWKTIAVNLYRGNKRPYQPKHSPSSHGMKCSYLYGMGWYIYTVYNIMYSYLYRMKHTVSYIWWNIYVCTGINYTVIYIGWNIQLPMSDETINVNLLFNPDMIQSWQNAHLEFVI